MIDQLSMLDLFSGTASASRAAAVRGWRVHRVDNSEDAAADERADLASWAPPPGPWDLVWASPPCTNFSTANQSTRDVGAGLELVRAALRIIREAQPRWWVLENVHGATQAIGKLIGPPVQRHGSFYLWGVFPPFEATVARDKTGKSGRQRARRRAAIPWAISEGLVLACERLAEDLPRRVPELAPSSLSAASPPAPTRSRSSPEPGPAAARADPGRSPDGLPTSLARAS
jgi:hypothetical protein